MKNIKFSYHPKATGLIRFYGSGCGLLNWPGVTVISGRAVEGVESILSASMIASSTVQWFGWILYIWKIRIVKLGNKKHKIDFTDYNITPREFLQKVIYFLKYKIYYPARLKLCSFLAK